MPKPPGELVGVYAIEGALTKNECGTAALPAADPLRFDVELRHEDGTGYWLQGMPPASPGTLSDDGDFSFAIEQTYLVDPEAGMTQERFTSSDPEALSNPSYYEMLDAAERRQPCSMRIVESIDGTVLRSRLDQSDDGDDADGEDAPSGDETRDADLVADNSITISPEAGADCRLVMRDEGGPFDALPCTAHYALVGTMLRDE